MNLAPSTVIDAWSEWARHGADARAGVLRHWLRQLPADTALVAEWLLARHLPRISDALLLPGYTGETNCLRLRGRGVFVVVMDPADPVLACAQLLNVLLAGNTALCVDNPLSVTGLESWVQPLDSAMEALALLDAYAVAGVSCAASHASLGDWEQAIRRAPGPLRTLLVMDRASILCDASFQGLVWEQTVTVNTAAMGGNLALLQAVALATEPGEAAD
ncbi:MAG TPA: hypothetical protein VL027_01285 [Spongiibacteraceae bacterium]|jgi:RHH-type proline utilization regulon transcriptional repressor/proline dehydrogenase/delta 1-pyrroline-5-carboxylate dehydrogenase|nr:hypothetical protein [Spongiibacteraceae bacterium]HUH36553.1 hypothetical protein [Spongiibacteraceae bacterium]